MQRQKEIEVEMLAAPDKQVSLTDPGPRSMKTRGQVPWLQCADCDGCRAEKTSCLLVISSKSKVLILG
ncbi:hypothetical protein A9R01_01715 ['Osedax' symbiont bacterium Rs2_46_30_T18]|nr:hypothetical protein A9R01_01715 ['Osedax' symbiont bacterium Rs2_46_30_T18]